MKKNNFKTFIQIDPMTGRKVVLRQKGEIPMESLKAVIYGTNFDEVISVLKSNGTCCFIDGKFVC